MDTSMIINAIVIALLAVTIFYAFRLERKLEGLRKAQAAFADVVRDLNTAAARAEAGIQGLKTAAESTGQALDEKIRKARGMSDELSLLIRAEQRASQRNETVRPVAPQPVYRTPAARASDALRSLGNAR